MPYIPQTHRDRYDDAIDALLNKLQTIPVAGDLAGDLAYVVARLMWTLDNCIQSFDQKNKIYGAVGVARNEYYRRLMSPYEDEAIKRNGDLL